jgi:hypothetical protein
MKYSNWLSEIIYKFLESDKQIFILPKIHYNETNQVIQDYIFHYLLYNQIKNIGCDKNNFELIDIECATNNHIQLIYRDDNVISNLACLTKINLNHYYSVIGFKFDIFIYNDFINKSLESIILNLCVASKKSILFLEPKIILNNFYYFYKNFKIIYAPITYNKNEFIYRDFIFKDRYML